MQTKTLLALAALLATALAAAPAGARVVHHWQFEDDPGFLENSGDDEPLTDAGATQSDLPVAGRGSAFAGIPTGNAAAADFAGTGEHLDAVLIGSPPNDFTVEVLAHFDALEGSFGEHIVGTAEGTLNLQIGWSLQYRFGADTLQLLLCLNSDCELVDSGLGLTTGVDYYIAAIYDLQNAGGGEVTFYLQNLTDDGELQTVTVPHSTPTRNQIPTFSIGATAAGTLPVDGLIDEVRVANTVLEESQLLIASRLEGCPAEPRSECTPLAKSGGSKIDIKSNGKLTWQWKKGSETNKDGFGDPADGTDPTNYALCIYDEVGGEPSLVGEYLAPGGEDWKEKKKGFQFKRKGAGLTKLILKAGKDKKAKIVDVKGKKLDPPDLPLAQDPRVTVQLVHDESGCWETQHSGPAKKNAAKGFKDKAD